MAYGAKKIILPSPAPAPVVGLASGWELIRTATFTNNVDITGLDGNVDKLWKLIVRVRHTANIFPNIRFNSDAGANYNIIRHRGGQTGVTSAHDAFVFEAQTSILFLTTGSTEVFAEILITAASGQNRMVIWQGMEWTSAATYYLNSGSGIWLNTTANITTINITTGIITAGEYFLFRQKS